ncbi:hypothetical protein MKW98_025535 [Papaver atlanticum]|uniref:Uncharacterized protein n=1 Tax=Papaver atlanticum TaxID=357466 RepID=A0AAD4SD06_9MAGN|nr:hypothetical protein MKW98_025535 [Papaver atlanticum]
MLGTTELQKLQDMVLCRQVSLRQNGYGLYEAQWLVAKLVLLAMYEIVLMNARIYKSSSSSGVGGGGGGRGDSGGSDAGNDGSITGGSVIVNDSDSVAVSEDGGGVTAWKVVVMEEQAMVEMTSFEEASTLMMALAFLIYEFGSKWVAGVLSGRLSLPSEGQMIKDVEAFYLELEAAAVPKHYTHRLAQKQFDHSDWLAAEIGCQPLEEWRKQMLKEHAKNYSARRETYRDEWDDKYLILQAQEDFCQYLLVEVRNG